jgi:hypothetical protein
VFVSVIVSSVRYVGATEGASNARGVSTAESLVFTDTRLGSELAGID